MTDLEIRLFEEHKSVDKICRDIYHSEKGVKTYIEQMETTPYSVSHILDISKARMK